MKVNNHIKKLSRIWEVFKKKPRSIVPEGAKPGRRYFTATIGGKEMPFVCGVNAIADYCTMRDCTAADFNEDFSNETFRSDEFRDWVWCMLKDGQRYHIYKIDKDYPERKFTKYEVGEWISAWTEKQFGEFMENYTKAMSDEETKNFNSNIRNMYDKNTYKSHPGFFEVEIGGKVRPMCKGINSDAMYCDLRDCTLADLNDSFSSEKIKGNKVKGSELRDIIYCMLKEGERMALTYDPENSNQIAKYTNLDVGVWMSTWTNDQFKMFLDSLHKAAESIS